MPTDRYFLNIAKAVAEGSKDPSRQIGAVIVNAHGRICATGYNGFAPRICDDGRLHDRAEKYPNIVHAEMNAILDAGNAVCRGALLYVYGLPPCAECAKLIVASGIDKVVCELPEGSNEETLQTWLKSADFTFRHFREAGIKFVANAHFPLTPETP
jgi:dCMP deaminase